MERATIKRLVPASVKTVLELVRDRLNGPGIEHAVLRENIFIADGSPVPRINFVIPDLSSAAAFGGVTTGLNFFDELVRALAPAGIEARLVSEKPIPRDNAALKYSALADCEFLSLKQNGYVMPTRASDLFVVFNWWVSLNLEPVLAAQARYFNRKPRPKLYLIQEYEPHFYPFSAAHLMAREAMGGRWPLWGIFNTTELHSFWLAQGHSAEKSYVFEPRMNAGLRPHADDLSPADKERIVLVYGRPQIPRNAFFLIQRGLERWARLHGAAHRDWSILSAGMAHADIRLGDAQRLTSLGKINLPDYARLLRKTAVGLSLMVSPHPSYPPLEMAHFGARVLTNAYPSKCPANRHENLVTLRSTRPEDIAEALEAEIVSFLADPTVGVRGKSYMPDYLEEDCIECVDAVATDILVEMGLRARPPPNRQLALDIHQRD